MFTFVEGAIRFISDGNDQVVRLVWIQQGERTAVKAAPRELKGGPIRARYYPRRQVLVMTKNIALRAAAIWLGIACLAIGNGMIREGIIVPRFGEATGLILSGFTLSIVVFAVTYFSFSFLGAKARSTCLFIGFQWVLMTLAFELLVGYFVAERTWSGLLQVFNLARGDLFSIVLLLTFLSPYLVARIRGAW